MATFFGTATNKVDGKGRVSLPARYRAEIERLGGRSVILAPATELGALDGCDVERINAVVRALDDPDRYTADQKARARIILARCEELAYEETGRLVLPRQFMELAGITGEATFVGIGSTFQIWKPKRYAEYEAGVLSDGAAASGSLADLPVPMPAREGA